MVLLRGVRLRRHIRTCEACRGHRFVPRVPGCCRQKVRIGPCPPSAEWARQILIEAWKAKGVDVMCEECHGLCAYEIYPKNMQGPAEYCPEPAEEGSSFCAEHDPDRCEPDWDDRRKELLYDCD